ncbi:MAG TPA: hypothetical protein V6D22_10400 [Candidatus Obscuribacterales bacterium]
MFLDRFLMAVVGLTFIAGGGFIAKNSLEAKNLIETALFGLLGVGIGIFLIISAVCGPPG